MSWFEQSAGGDAPSPGRLVPFRAAEPEPFVFERLEYGKLCMTEDGPIEPGVDCYPLATSKDFPDSVEPFCLPWILGIGSEMAPGAPHGFVVRCVLVEGVLFQVFCRLRQRPERGEGQPGRCFWRGRYLCCRQGVADPFTGFEASTEDREMLGITLRKAKETWKPIRKAAQSPPQIDGPLDSFLQQALELVLSGIPVGIAGGIDESAFFQHATALWFLLPPPLRALFSAGWAVSPSEAASLHLSAAPQFPPSIAVFDRVVRQWTLPTRVDQIQADGELRSRPFGEDLLIPGRMFLREAFEWTSEGRARLHGLAPRLDHLEGFDYGIRTSKETKFVVDARSAWARERFRRPGLRSLDHARTVELESWLRGTWEGDPAMLCLGTSQYFFPEARRQVFARGLAAMAQPETQSRGDEVVWSSLVEDESHSFWDSEESAPSVFALVRSRLMRALAIRGWQAVLSTLEAATQQEAALDLPADAVARLDAELTASLEDAGSLPYHVRLLQPLNVPEPYRAWAVARSARLAIALGTANDPTAELLPLEETLERLQKISTDQAVTVLLRLHLRKAPTQEDVINLGALAPDDTDLLTRNLLALWHRRGEHTREEREALFPWVRLDPLLQRPASSDPLLAILRPWPENATQKASILQGFLEEIQKDHIPESLEEWVAAVTLEYWDLYRKHYVEAASSKPWQRLIAHWPPEAAFALAGIDITNQKRQPAPESQNILRALKLPCETLDALIADHVARRSQREIVGKASKLLWSLCDRCISSYGPLTAAELCRHLTNGSLPDGHPTVPDEGKRDLMIKLARSIPGLELPDLLWPQAIHGWQIRFLLELAPGADLQPTPEQLSTLIKERAWLRKHLTDYARNAKRRQRFDIASRDFHELKFPQGWRNEYRQGPFWAAFRGVPLNLQGNLREALTAYSASPQEVPGYVITYLDGQFDRDSLEPNASEELFRRIARAAFAPYLSEEHLGARDLEAIFQYHERRKPSFLGPDVHFVSHGRPFAKSKEGDKIFVAIEFKKLIEKVAAFDAVKTVVAEVRRVLERQN